MRRTHLAAYFFALGILVCGARCARAQDDSRGWEVGGQFSVFDAGNGQASVMTFVPCTAPCTFTAITTTRDGRAADYSFGGRAGYRLDRHFTAEAEVNYFPRGRALSDSQFNGGRKTQGLFGVKFGRRYDHFGIFAKARPGFVRFGRGDFTSNGNPCILSFPPPLGCFEPKSRMDFAFDMGGVVELYPSAHAIIRFDAGDTVLHSAAHIVPVAVPGHGTFAVGVESNTTHNFQAGVGLGFRF